MGRLYQLPVAASKEFAEYHRQRRQLREIFRGLSEEIVGVGDPRADLPFHIALSVIEMRPNNGVVPEPLSTETLPAKAIMLADAALAVLGAELPDNRVERTLELLNQLN